MYLVRNKLVRFLNLQSPKMVENAKEDLKLQKLYVWKWSSVVSLLETFSVRHFIMLAIPMILHRCSSSETTIRGKFR